MAKLLCLAILSSFLTAFAQTPRARDLGIPFDGKPGPLNAITDVKGVAVGHSTIIRDTNVRTGVTAVLPRGRDNSDAVFAGWFSLNGNGEMTGTTWIEESGFLEGPVMITNTHSVGIVRDAVIEHQVKNAKPGMQSWGLPVVAETYDGHLNDINGFHVKREHAFEAIDTAKSGVAVPEGSVGGGTGMVCHEFKGGIGTASRLLPGGYTLGVLVQCNYGLRRQLRIAGAPVGQEIAEGAFRQAEQGSIIIVIATDAPLLPHQLKRLARRASMGIARTGSTSGNGSGDIFVAFSTANPQAAAPKNLRSLQMVPNEELNPIFNATIEAVEESVVNALVAGRTLTGFQGHTVLGLPHDKTVEALKRYNRLK
ncbi:aminopeptidase [Bryobacterales bacterium F-183]|nr:aminopeptidase [Bryobacterales bacterium F-183]